MSAVEIGYRIGRWWQRIDWRLRWLAVVLLTALIGVTLYQEWVGYDAVRSVGGAVLVVIVFSLALWLIDVAANAVRRVLERAGLWKGLTEFGSVIGGLLKAVIWLAVMGVVIAVALWAVGSMSTPVAIIVGALIIAGAIGASRR